MFKSTTFGGPRERTQGMRTKLLRGRDEVTVQLVYPSTLDEYRQALDALGGSLPAAGNGDSPPAGCRPGHAAYVVTTTQQRHLWDLPDLAVSGGVVPVDEPRALDLLHDAAVEPGRAAGLFPGRSPEVVSALDTSPPGGSWFDAVRDFLTRGARIDQAIAALDRAGLPSAVHEALSERMNAVFDSGAKVAEAQLDRVRVGTRPAVGEVRAPAVRPGSCGAGARPHPRRARRRQGRHPTVPRARAPRRATC